MGGNSPLEPRNEITLKAIVYRVTHESFANRGKKKGMINNNTFSENPAFPRRPSGPYFNLFSPTLRGVGSYIGIYSSGTSTSC